jgi:hypothetical protein
MSSTAKGKVNGYLSVALKIFEKHDNGNFSNLEAKSLDWKISVFCYSLLMRNRGYIEFEMLEKLCCSYLRNITTAVNYFFYKHFAHYLPILLIAKIWLSIRICKTLGSSILKMSPQKGSAFDWAPVSAFLKIHGTLGTRHFQNVGLNQCCP